MKEELKKLLNDFVDAVNKHNEKRHDKNAVNGTDFEDNTELTFTNFIKWIDYEV